MDSIVVLRRLFQFPWEGETLALEISLIEAMEKWEKLTGGGLPCPVTLRTYARRRNWIQNRELRTGL